MDVHVDRAITTGLRRRTVDVITAQEDGSATLPDSLLLDRATALKRVLFTQDEDLLSEASARQAMSSPFAGVIYSHQGSLEIGGYVRELEPLAKVYDPADMFCRIVWIPLR